MTISATLASTEAEAAPSAQLLALAGTRARPCEPQVAGYLSGLAKGSRASQLGALERVAAIASGGRLEARAFPWHTLRRPHLQALRAILEEMVAPRTANRWLSAVRGVLRECWHARRLSLEDFQAAASVRGFRVAGTHAGRSLSATEIHALFGACSGDRLELRDRALFALLLGCGLRRAELLQLERQDAADAAATRFLQIAGKGGTARTVPVPAGTRRSLLAFLGSERVPLDSPLFLGRAGGPAGLRMPGDRCKARGEAAQLRPFTPHDLRRTYCTALLAAGVDALLVARMAGHASPETTLAYDRRDADALEAAAATLLVPA